MSRIEIEVKDITSSKRETVENERRWEKFSFLFSFIVYFNLTNRWKITSFPN